MIPPSLLFQPLGTTRLLLSLRIWLLLVPHTSTHVLFWWLFAWNNFFHPFAFILFMSLDLKWVSCRCSHILCFYQFCQSLSFDWRVYFSSVQSLSHVWLFATPWTVACQASLSITNSQFTQTHVHWVSDVIQPSHSLLSPSPPAFNLSQHQGLFQWVSFSLERRPFLRVQKYQFFCTYYGFGQICNDMYSPL